MALFSHRRPGPVVTSDASGSWGCSAFTHDSLDWFQLRWPSEWQHANLTTKELLPVIITAALWGKHWCGKQVQFVSDNQAVVATLSTGRAGDPQLLHLLKCFFFWKPTSSLITLHGTSQGEETGKLMHYLGIGLMSFFTCFHRQHGPRQQYQQR